MRYKEIIGLLETMKVSEESQPIKNMLIEHFQTEKRESALLSIAMVSFLVGALLMIGLARSIK